MRRQKSTIQDIYCLQDLNIPTLNAVMSLNIEDTGGQFYQVDFQLPRVTTIAFAILGISCHGEIVPVQCRLRYPGFFLG